MHRSVVQLAGRILTGAALTFSLAAWSHADTLSEIRDRGEFRLGHRESSAPFSYLDARGEAVGYSVDICRFLYDRVKAELKRPDLKLRFVPLKPADRIAAVKDGRVDVECGSTTNTVERQKDVSFSYTTFMAGARFLGKKGAGFREVTDLRGKAVVVTEKTTTEKVVRQLNTERNLNFTIVTAKDHAEAFARLAKGEVAAVANDDALLVGLVSAAPDPSLYEFIGKYVSVEPYGVMYRRDDVAFTKVIDSAIATLFGSGQIRVIYGKWFESGAFKLPMNQYMKENVKLPNKYGVQ